MYRKVENYVKHLPWLLEGATSLFALRGDDQISNAEKLFCFSFLAVSFMLAMLS